MRIIFIGTSEFASVILDYLIKNNYVPVLTVTETDKPIGRNLISGSPSVKLFAQKHNIEIIQPKRINDSMSEIKSLNPDLIVTASYGQIIPQEILIIPKYGSLNVHPSLLPLYRGSSPIQKTILNGDQETGITIIKMTEKVDAGPVVAIKKIENEIEKMTYQELHDELANMGARILVEIIPEWISGKINLIPQDESRVVYTEKIIKKDGEINWSLSADEIERKIRAFNPWPGTFSCYRDKKTNQKKTIKIIDADVQKQTDDGPFGPLGKVYMATNNRLAVQTGKDFLIIKKIQIENKNQVNVEDFINGNFDFIGIILGQ